MKHVITLDASKGERSIVTYDGYRQYEFDDELIDYFHFTREKSY